MKPKEKKLSFIQGKQSECVCLRKNTCVFIGNGKGVFG